MADFTDPDSLDSTLSSDTPSYYVGIGASAGGLEAIEAFFRNMPSDSGMAFIVVQHLSPDYKSLMVELLSKRTEMNVLRAEDGMVVKKDHVYLIPPKKNLVIFHGKLLLKEQDPNQGINLPIDIFLRSLAEDKSEHAVAVILSGTGSDGARGVRAIKEANGMVMVQNEESAKFDGMPRAAIATGCADYVRAPDEMPGQLMSYVNYPFDRRREQTNRILTDDENLTRIFSELRDKTKVDFTFYKPSTIIRRLERRMVVCQAADLDEYVRYLYNNPSEVHNLYRDLLIGVTSFFRDPDAFMELSDYHLKGILSSNTDREVRFWVAGCSTGEEAYTLAILVKDTLEKLSLSRDVKIFATDIDKDAIVRAGAGLYPESIAADLSPKLLGKYFYRKGDNYQIARTIREMVVFAQHNLVKDPPFTNIDLVSCRNLLIYLQPVLQHKAMLMFNFSLRPGGILFLGGSETVGDMVDSFAPLHQKYKIYESKGKASIVGQTQPFTVSDLKNQNRIESSLAASSRRMGVKDDSWILNRYLDLLATRFIPLSVIVNQHMEVLHVIGNTEGFFRVPSGRAVYDISRMVSKELAIPLATGIQKVFRTHEEITYTNIFVMQGESARNVRMRIVPFPERKGQESLVTVFFEVVKKEEGDNSHADVYAYDLSEEAQEHIKDLELELQFTKESLQATIEELETSNEELQATNEELLASNEELQSTNEELQSTNEELYTVNSEYQNKINELTELNNDVDNLLTVSRIGKLLLNEDLEIRKFSPEVTKIFRIMDKDVGRPITHIVHSFVDFDPIEAIKGVQRNNAVFEKDVYTDDGRIYLIRILPYHIAPRTFSGVVVTFVDITELKQIKDDLSESRKKAEDIIRFMPAGLFLYCLDESGDLVLESSNPEAERLTGIETTAWRGRTFNHIWPRAHEQGLTAKFLDVLKTGETCYLEHVEYRDDRLSGVYRIQAFRLPENRLAISFEDTTQHHRTLEELRQSEVRYRRLFESLPVGVVYYNENGFIESCNPAATSLLGVGREVLIGRRIAEGPWKFVFENGTEIPEDQYPSSRAMESGTPILNVTMGVCRPSGEILWVNASALPEVSPGPSKCFRGYLLLENRWTSASGG